MRKVHISKIAPGMVLGKTIYSSTGQVLLGEGMILNGKYLERLNAIGLLTVYIKDGITDDIPIPNIIDEKTRIETQYAVKNLFSSVEKGHRFDLNSMKSYVNIIMDELLSGEKVIFDLIDTRTKYGYTFRHSVNVTILSILTGMSMNYNQLQLHDLGFGALLHNLGRTQVGTELLDKAEKLDPDELLIMQKHCALGFDLIRRDETISLISAHIAFQHHERYDGTGYPRGLSGDQIHEYARIVAYCDIYDALTSARPYRDAFEPIQALKTIMKMVGTQLDPNIATAFFQNVATIPFGSIIQLNTNEIGIVIRNNKDFLTQPTIRMILDRNRKPLKDAIDIDLAENKNYQIIRLLDETDPLFPSITQFQDRIQCHG